MTGKTLKSISGALAAAANGKKVLVVCSSYSNRRSLFGEAKRTVGRWDVEGCVEVRVASCQIVFPNGGFVHFATDDVEVMGREYTDAMGVMSEAMASRVRLEE